MKRVLPIALVLLIAANLLMVARIKFGGIRIDEMKPEIGYKITLRTDMDLHGVPAMVSVFLPHNNPSQRILSEKIESSRASYDVITKDGNRIGRWQTGNIEGHESGIYEALVQIKPVRYHLWSETALPQPIPEPLLRYLQPTEAIQSDATEIRAEVERLLNGVTTIDDQVRTLYDFVSFKIELSNYENSLDAITALRWREAHCGGKSRLLAALLRASGIPARLVGGFELKSGSRRTSHLWVEIWINGYWIPLDPVKNLFAERPNNILTMFRGDNNLITRTENINFKYVIKIKKWRLAPEEHAVAGTSSLLDAYSFWNVFRKAHISLNLLRLLLLLPIACLILIICRTVIGIHTLGTFMPALMAVAFRDTGLVWGLSLYATAIAMGALVRLVIDQLYLIHTCRLGVIMLFTITLMLGVTYYAVSIDVLEPAHMSMFPIALITINIERSFQLLQEKGGIITLKVLAGTFLVISLSYGVIASEMLQAIVFVFPEILLAVLATYIVLGRWSGMRLLEYRRFRILMVE